MYLEHPPGTGRAPAPHREVWQHAPSPFDNALQEATFTDSQGRTTPKPAPDTGVLLNGLVVEVRLPCCSCRCCTVSVNLWQLPVVLHTGRLRRCLLSACLSRLPEYSAPSLLVCYI